MKKILLLILVVLSIKTSTQAQEYETGSDASTNFPANDIDTKDYSTIPVVKEIEDCFGDSYVYYFTVGETRFRAVHINEDSLAESVTIQKYSKGKWYNRLGFQSQNKFACFTLKDINNDGFKDLVREKHFDAEVYFFNPAINNFIDSVGCDINYDIHLIDSERHIYCDFQEYRGNCENIHTTLYTIINFKKTILYVAELINCNSKGEQIPVTTIMLHKFNNTATNVWEKVATIHLKTPLDQNKENYFNNKAFWLKRYKKLMGYK